MEITNSQHRSSKNGNVYGFCLTKDKNEEESSGFQAQIPLGVIFTITIKLHNIKQDDFRLIGASLTVQ